MPPCSKYFNKITLCKLSAYINNQKSISKSTWPYNEKIFSIYFFWNLNIIIQQYNSQQQVNSGNFSPKIMLLSLTIRSTGRLEHEKMKSVYKYKIKPKMLYIIKEVYMYKKVCIIPEMAHNVARCVLYRSPFYDPF